MDVIASAHNQCTEDIMHYGYYVMLGDAFDIAHWLIVCISWNYEIFVYRYIKQHIGKSADVTQFIIPPVGNYDLDIWLNKILKAFSRCINKNIKSVFRLSHFIFPFSIRDFIFHFAFFFQTRINLSFFFFFFCQSPGTLFIGNKIFMSGQHISEPIYSLI